MIRPSTGPFRDWLQAARYFVLEGFEVGQSICKACTFRVNCVHPPGTDWKGLECPFCGCPRSDFIPWNEEKAKG
jgi:hypothetical protein